MLHPVFGFPIISATSLKGVSRAYARWVLGGPRKSLISSSEGGRPGACGGICCSWKESP